MLPDACDIGGVSIPTRKAREHMLQASLAGTTPAQASVDHADWVCRTSDRVSRVRVHSVLPARPAMPDGIVLPWETTRQWPLMPRTRMKGDKIHAKLPPPRAST